MPATREQFERFYEERKYVHNVSPDTLLLYKLAWKRWDEHGPAQSALLLLCEKGGQLPLDATSAYDH